MGTPTSGSSFGVWAVAITIGIVIGIGTAPEIVIGMAVAAGAIGTGVEIRIA
jgi:hypothetical protein